MADDKKISQLVELTTLDGEELFVARKGSGNNSVSVNTLKNNIRSGMVAQQPGKGLSANDYTNEDKSKLSALPTNAELSSSLSGKQPLIVASEDIVPQSGGKLTLTQQAKLALFVDMWNQACGNYGKYDPVNAPDAEHPYLLNDLWLTYQESMAIMLQYQSWGTGSVDFLWTDVKTNIRARSSSARTYSNSYNGLTVVNLLNIYPTSMHTCLRGSGLKRILNLNAAYMTAIHQSCFNAPNLEVLQISNLKINLDLSNCPLINLASWQGMIQTAANTSPITVTVHPDVYAKIANTSADVKPYLPANILGGALQAGSPNTAVVNGAVEITREYRDTYFILPLDTPLSIRRGEKYTLSFDVEGLAQGETWNFALSASGHNLGYVPTHNGRCVQSLNPYIGLEALNRLTIDDYEREGLDLSITTPIRLSNFALSRGVYTEAPYTEPLSLIEDADLRERVEWANLLKMAEGQGITFATV